MKPHTWITRSRQVAALWILVVLVIVVGGLLDQLRPPGGWIGLEFPAMTDVMATNAPSLWQPHERERALFALGLDSLFLVLYPLLLSLLCARAAENWRLPAWLANLCGLLAGVVLLAAPLDALENAGLYLLIMGNESEALQLFITAMAAPKWLLAITTGLVWLACIPIHLRRK